MVLACWVVVELQVPDPLVNVRLLAHGPLLRANLAMLIAGAGLYLLFSVFTRYVQTPAAAQYGFALPGVAAGAALIPFSLLGFAAGKALPRMVARFTERWTYAVSIGFAAAAAALFVAADASLVAVLVAIALLGFGVGGVSAVMPRLVLAGVPIGETSSVLSISQVVRSIGFSIGSALAGFLLATATPDGSPFPAHGGYAEAALWALVPLAVSAGVILANRAAPHR